MYGSRVIGFCKNGKKSSWIISTDKQVSISVSPSTNLNVTCTSKDNQCVGGYLLVV